MCMGRAGWLCTTASLTKQKEGSQFFPGVKRVIGMESTKNQHDIQECLSRKGGGCCAHFAVVLLSLLPFSSRCFEPVFGCPVNYNKI